MKKQYTAPEVEVATITATSVIATSVGFGSGSTSGMHGKERDDFDDDDAL